MLTETEIQQALHARRVVRLSVANPHGPLGLEQVAASVAAIAGSAVAPAEKARIRRPISVSVHAWEKLEQLARTAGQAQARPVSPSDVATAILEQFVATTEAPSD